MHGDQFGEFEWILGLKGLKEISWEIIFFSGPLLQYQENWIAI